VARQTEGKQGGQVKMQSVLNGDLAARLKAQAELEEARAPKGFVKFHTQISDSWVVDVIYQDESGETKRFEEFAAAGVGD
jgi:hypothetical protein